MIIRPGFYDRDYFENGVGTGKSGYSGYNFTPDYFAMAHQLLDYFHPSVILDLGCAKGFLVKAIRDYGGESYGIDLSSYAIKEAPEDIRDVVYEGSSTDLSRFTDSKFDLVVAYDILEHLTDSQLDSTMKEVHRVASKWVIMKAPFQKYDWDLDKSHIGIRPQEEWVEIFKKYGFKVHTPSIPKSPWTFWDDRTLIFEKE